jgi:hypothetical protein
MHSQNLSRVLPALLLGAATCASGALAKSTSAAAAGPAPALTTYTASDQSASVGVPSGWHVTRGANGVIQMSGPQGEDVALGEGIFVQSGPVGAPVSAPMKFSMPAASKLGQKYMMLWKQAAAAAGQPDPQIKILSARHIPIASGIADCGVVMGSTVMKGQPQKFETQFCSLRPDSGGVYKLVWNHATLPDAQAASERATVEAVMHSYRPSATTIKLWIQPYTQPPPMPMGGAGMPMGGGGMSPGYWGQIGADHSAECMDLGVIREEPEWRLPSYCN